MFSIYSTAFNVIENDFDHEEAIHNFCSFADEVVLSVNKSRDNTLEELRNLQNTYSNLSLIEENISLEDPQIDGKLFNSALQETSQEFKIYLGLDFRIPIWQKEKWKELAYSIRFSEADGYLIPLINLWGDKEHIRWDKDKNMTFESSLHKGQANTGGILSRGVPDFAKYKNGKFDPSKTDSSTLIRQNGEPSKLSFDYSSAHIPDREGYLCSVDRNGIFLYHLGYLSFEHRVKVNNDLWKKQWEEIRGSEEKVMTTKKELSQFDTYRHGLKLWNE